MKRRLSFKSTWVLVPACMLAAGLATWGRDASSEVKPRLAGQWTLNQDQSDDASQKVSEALANAKVQRDNSAGGGGGNPGGGGYPGTGGGYPGGGGIGFPGGRGGMGGGMGRRGQRGATQPSGLSKADLDPLATSPKLLSVTQDEKLVAITDDNGQTKNLYPDGKKHKEKDASGQSTTFKTHWEGNHLVAESKLAHAGKLTETYELEPGGKKLVVISQLDNSQLSEPLVIRRVYDRAGESGK